MRRSFVAAALLVLTALPAHAQILSNFGAGPFILATNLGFDGGPQNRVTAVGVGTGANAFEFISMRVALGTNASIGGPVTGGIYSDVGGNPGALLQSLSTVDVPGSPVNVWNPYTLTPTAPFTLAAGTNYWFVLTGPGTANFTAWARNVANDAPTAAQGALFLGNRFSLDAGGSWQNLFANPVIELNARPVSVVPEPGTYALLATGLVGLLAVRRRRA